ncbi:hypothetical protein ACFL0R_00985 [Pseudomonadota bacterium]
MKSQQEQLHFSQVHIDAARNATDDFNAFHDPYKWQAIHDNPFGSTIALGFQLEALIEFRIKQFREEHHETPLLARHQLHFSNFQISFADVVQPNENFEVTIKPTTNNIDTKAQLSNRISIRKGRRLVIMGYQRESQVPLVCPETDFSTIGNLSAISDRSNIMDNHYFLKRKFMNTSNGKNFLVGSLVDQHIYFDELENRVEFPGMFPTALLSCALLEKVKQEGHDFYRKPMVYTQHAISIDRRHLTTLRSNDCLHMLVQGPETVPPEKGLGKLDIPQTAYNCFGLIHDNQILYRARVQMALLEDVIATSKAA